MRKFQSNLSAAESHADRVTVRLADCKPGQNPARDNCTIVERGGEGGGAEVAYAETPTHPADMEEGATYSDTRHGEQVVVKILGMDESGGTDEGAWMHEVEILHDDTGDFEVGAQTKMGFNGNVDEWRQVGTTGGGADDGPASAPIKDGDVVRISEDSPYHQAGDFQVSQVDQEEGRAWISEDGDTGAFIDIEELEPLGDGS